VGVIDGLLAKFGYVKASGAQAPYFLRAGLGSGQYHPDIPDYSLAHNQAELYQRLVWVHIAESTIGQTVAGTDLQVKARKGDKTEAVENHPFELLMDKPNPLQSRTEFLTATCGYYDLTGNAYWWLNRASESAPPSEMWLIPSHQIKPIPDGKMYLRGYLYDPGNGEKEIELDTTEVVHFRRFHPLNRFVGLSVIEALAIDAGGELAMQKWNYNFFGKKNAKMDGVLGFASAIGDSDWAAIQRDFEQEHGGVQNKRMLLLRNTGDKGINYTQVGINQRDMEFLNARNFTKEEIFAAFAPGLASMLAVNATEANSVAGKATFMEFGVWPRHVAFAETITKHILPAYGDNLIAEFDDVRLSDRAMELQEQAMAFKVMTVAEAREKYHQLPPLNDERDNKIVDGPPEPGTMQPALPPGMPAAQPDGKQPEPPNEDKEVAGQRTSDEEPDEGMKADLLRWQRKAIKRVKAGKDALCEFESEDIPHTLAEAIKGALEVAAGIDGARRVFQSALSWDSYP